MASGDNQGAAEAWRPGALSAVHVAFGFCFLVCLAMAVFSLGA
ncbi:MAG TPA: hypothetical protein VG943_01205 [Caulobacterales bacterium]|nr:hypothetical protein [Caulobacterales bacterium]